MDVSSYRSICLLPTFSKVLEELISKINKDLNPQVWITINQFGFRQVHSTVQQCYRVTYFINKAMENQQYCKAAFFDVSQAFGEVWDPWLLVKIKRIFPSSSFNLLNSYLNESQFETKFN
jgi:inhibitor of KinA sporulation pathway (predicted exonuclease)